jgi:hypothetical protein
VPYCAYSLGSVGELDPENGGAFEITLPDFTRDPLYKGAGDFPRFGNFGTIQLVLLDRAIGRSLASIKPEIAGPDLDLNPERIERIHQPGKVHDGALTNSAA